MNKYFSVFTICFLTLFFSWHFCAAQNNIQGSVIDSKTKSPLPFCAVAVKGSVQGSITNEEGVFKLSADSSRDTLIFSYVGYKSKIIPVSALKNNFEIFLDRQSVALREIAVHGNDDYLYEILDKCRKKILDSKSHITKTYFLLETEIEKQPVEMLEAYYNGKIKAGNIEELALKNGRIGLARVNDGSFVNLDMSRAMTNFNITYQNDFFPLEPLQMNKSKVKKNYSLVMLSEFSDENTYHITFYPREKNDRCFSGEVWIDKNSYSLVKINLKVSDTPTHPFMPLWSGDSLKNVSMNISETYSIIGDESILSNINFNYQLVYIDFVNKRRTAYAPAQRVINSAGIFWFYDYENPFILPHFKYDASANDYRKISSVPYNELFWKNNPGLVFTEQQNHVLDFFAANGHLVNYSRKLFKGTRDKFSFEFSNYIQWSDTARLQLSKNKLDSVLHKNYRTQNLQTKSEMFNLQTQICFDADSANGSVHHLSVAIFDAVQSFYNLPEEPFTNCFINIYFDLCEIERRRMEKILDEHSYTLMQTDSVYLQTLNALQIKTEKYLHEVQRGNNGSGIEKWNAFVKENLGIDNIKIYDLSGQ
jgi:hypothetical protein